MKHCFFFIFPCLKSKVTCERFPCERVGMRSKNRSRLINYLSSSSINSSQLSSSSCYLLISTSIATYLKFSHPPPHSSFYLNQIPIILSKPHRHLFRRVTTFFLLFYHNKSTLPSFHILSIRPSQQETSATFP